MSERINAGVLLAAIGAVALFVALFLDWYGPGLTAWTVFEIVDLLLAGIAAFVLLVAALHAANRPLRIDEDRVLPVVGAAALLLVIVSIVNNPPAANGLSEETGAWIALAGAILIGLGAVLAQRRISVVITPRERTGAAHDTDPYGDDEETRPINPA